ncbi:hypothetical protein WMF18_33010 [Sorangium sp. So ce315]|uniref:hypothetical protein n=1 Tax=Sorangium sp. So ce315 TaxID=3133299 RepID=UPI003F60831B
MEYSVDCSSMEDARNRAVEKLEELTGGSLGPYVKVVIGKNMGGDSPLAGVEVGVEWGKRGRIRLDFDPFKGPHYNVETRHENWAFCFPYSDHEGSGNSWAILSDEERQAVKEWMRRIGQRRGTR